MWLLDTDTLNVHYFARKDTPGYAILSHRWEAQEVTFRHLVEVNKVVWSAEETEHDREKMLSELLQFPYLAELQAFRMKQLEVMKGWIKVKDFCRKARSLGYKWAWSDTCCIDKSSSAELQEAVNSMFAWYMDSAICLAYLSDVGSAKNPTEVDMEQFRNSKWFTRGWTLQELLAPQTVVFCDCEWVEIGDRGGLETEIHKATNVPIKFLSPENFFSADFSEKMSWVADRHTARPEDLVYCMIGLFRINMPLIYGEGIEMAFLRFQNEYLKIYRDDTMFIWERGNDNLSFEHGEEGPNMGLLAARPRQFSKSQSYKRMNFRPRSGAYRPCLRSFDWNVSRAGTLLTIQLKLYPKYSTVPELIRYAYLSYRKCPLFHTSEGRVIYMLLGQRKDAGGSLIFDRVGPLFEDSTDPFFKNIKPEHITINGEHMHARVTKLIELPTYASYWVHPYFAQFQAVH